MTRLMEKVIEQLRGVPEGQQDQLAQFLLHELAEDERWERSTQDHAGTGEEGGKGGLKGLIDNVLADDADGRCEPLDPERL